MDPSSNLHFLIFHGHFLVASYIIIISLCLTFDERSSFHGSLDVSACVIISSFVGPGGDHIES